ncbi:DUF4864 domain-containing protein [Marinobacter fonticola]|uniref:DUF4864 domain-containing protein n=1 Tax=Marinobacter fonticola TaxID=2603215 RepID=UPI001D0DA8A3|nr:DUF4864 domain-containing protein [Marinobacter fonticola]
MKSRNSFLHWLALTVVALIFAVGAQADEKSHEAVQAVINAQLDAFAQRNDALAFSYASPAIQHGFSNAEAFGDMVRKKYPAVYGASTVRFREQVPHPGFVVQRVLLVGPKGLYWDAFYRMEQQDGAWRIGGVVLKPRELGI